MKKQIKTKELRNKEMNDVTYTLRRKVINLIYEVKEIVNIPRLDVRITDDHKTTLAVARIKQNIIWISSRAIKEKAFDLRTIVYHEIIHAVFGIRHIESCPLMKAIHTPLDKNACQRILKSYAV